MPAPEPVAPRRLSLGVIFLTLYIDLIGFSIIFPLGPDLLRHYLDLEGTSGLLGWMLAQIESVARALGNETHLPEVLFGGVISSLFSVLQFIFAPFWGGLSDRRPICSGFSAAPSGSFSPPGSSPAPSAAIFRSPPQRSRT